MKIKTKNKKNYGKTLILLSFAYCNAIVLSDEVQK